MNYKNNIVALVGPSAVGKSTMLDLLSNTKDFEVLNQVTKRSARPDDNYINCLDSLVFDNLKKDEFWFRHGGYGILKSEYQRGLATGKNLVCIAGAFEIVQLKSSSYSNRILSVLLGFPGTDTEEINKVIRERMSERINFNIRDRIFENLVYQDVFYSNPDFRNEYIDLSLISEEKNNNFNLKKIINHTLVNNK